MLKSQSPLPAIVAQKLASLNDENLLFGFSIPAVILTGYVEIYR